MVLRSCLPGEMFLDAAVIAPGIRRERAPGKGDWAQPAAPDPELEEALRKRGAHIALRWMLNPALGIPLAPFTVWRRPASERPAPEEIPNMQLVGTTYSWDGMTEMLHIEIEVDEPVIAEGLSRNRQAPVCQVEAGPGRLVLDGGPMVAMRISRPGAVTSIRALSSTSLAQSQGWKEIEIVGLPVPERLSGTSYYDESGQGEIGAPVDALTAAKQRLSNWGPISGWPGLIGLPAWQPPDPGLLTEEFGAELIADLLAVMAKFPPPLLGEQFRADSPPRALPEFAQVAGGQAYRFGSTRDIGQSSIVTRPLQLLSMAVASDCFASLALGYGTGAPLGELSGIEGRKEQGYDDFMVTAPWRGTIRTLVQRPGAWPGIFQPGFVEGEVARELAAIVLSPGFRDAPAAPAPLNAVTSHIEGAITPDAPFTSSVRVEVARDPAGIRQPRASGYALARFEKPESGLLRLQPRRRAGGWLPLSAAMAVAPPGQPSGSDPSSAVVALRDSAVALPFSGSIEVQYAAAAADLFGQWSQWNTSWFSLDAAGVQVPAVLAVKANTAPGPGLQDPCRLRLAVDIAWDASERSCHYMNLVVDIHDPNPPPDPVADPPASPQPGLSGASCTIEFDPDGRPLAHSPDVDVTLLQPDNSAVGEAGWQDPGDRRYRITWDDIALPFAGAREKGIAPYIRAAETVAPGRWSSWGQPGEMSIVFNPLPPPPPPLVSPQYPLWASLPDAGGLSRASVSWWPTGAAQYRVYEATEAAILAACQRPGPVLTRDLGARMEDLFALHRNGANLPAIRAAYRKLGEAAILPPPQPNGALQYEAPLPRGSALIHCFIVVGVSDTGVVSGWPLPNPQDGREGFIAYAIPHPLQPPKPEVSARLIGAVPRITALIGGARPVTEIEIRRTSRPVLARSFATMEKIGTVTPDLAEWHRQRETGPSAPQQAGFSDTGAPGGWQWLQYRVVARYSDEPGRAGMAIASEASDAFQLLNPPAEPPALSLTELADKRSATRVVIRIDCDAPRPGTAIGDHLLAWTLRSGADLPVRGAVAVSAIPEFASLNAFLAAGVPLGFVGEAVFLSVTRAGGKALALTIDLTDPLSRSSRRQLDAPEYLAPLVPVIHSATATRRQSPLPAARGHLIGLSCNAPTGAGAAGWAFLVSWQRSDVLLATRASRSFTVDQIPLVRSADAIGTLRATAAQMFRIAKTGQFGIWIPGTTPLAITVTLSNRAGRSATRRISSP